MEKKFITVKVFINAAMEKVWQRWTEPQHIIRWNQPSADWHTTHVENDVVTGGKFLYAMRAKDGSAGFDFQGVYDEVVHSEKIRYTLTDGRETTTLFVYTGNGVTITEIFEPEKETPLDEQERFCGSVLETFKKYVEELA